MSDIQCVSQLTETLSIDGDRCVKKVEEEGQTYERITNTTRSAPIRKHQPLFISLERLYIYIEMARYARARNEAAT